MADHPIRYRNYEISPADYQVPGCRYWFQHVDWDGAPNNAGEGPADRRYGYDDDVSGCMLQIDDQIEEQISGSSGKVVHITEGKKS
jgi:hypothetical protein